MTTTIVLVVIGAGTLAWCLRAVAVEVRSGHRHARDVWRGGEARGPAEAYRAQADVAKNAPYRTEALMAKADVMVAVTARIRAGLAVSDADIADLVEETGASVEVVFETLDAMSGR